MGKQDLQGRRARVLQWFLTTFRVLGLVMQFKRMIDFCREMSQIHHTLPGTVPQAIVGRCEPSRISHPDRFMNDQGLFIHTRQWFPQAHVPRGIVFVFHGFAEHCGRYQEIACHLAKEGFAVFAFDHQGHGQSEGTRGHVERFSDYVNDAINYISLVLFEGRFHEYDTAYVMGPSTPKFLLGHSMGGLLAIHVCHSISSLCAISTSSTSPCTIDWNAVRGKTAKSKQWKQTAGSWRGIVLSSPVLMSDPSTASSMMSKVRAALSDVLPKMPGNHVNPKFISNDPYVVETYTNDPLVYHGGMRARWTCELLTAMHRAMQLACHVTWPLIIYQGKNDKLCNPEGAKRFHGLSGSRDKRLVEFPGMQHEVLNELGRDKVIKSLVFWVAERSSPASLDVQEIRSQSNIEHASTEHTDIEVQVAEAPQTQSTPSTASPSTTPSTATPTSTASAPPSLSPVETAVTVEDPPSPPPTPHEVTCSTASSDPLLESSTAATTTMTEGERTGDKPHVTLMGMAAHVMLTPDIALKAALTKQYAAMWLTGQVTDVGRDEFCVSEPARPAHVKMVPPNKVKQHGIVGLIHSIAHAESYAIDLSWDIVGRFAHLHTERGGCLPRAFFDDWVRVANDEAHHFESWAARLTHHGSHYGAMNAHAGLWEAADSTKGDLKLRLAMVHLVHEGRGLDTAPIAIDKFIKAGDIDSATTASFNSSQEIGHVGAAVKWFKHMCEQQGIDDAIGEFRGIVQARFKGKLKPPFNNEARLQAGMTPAWYQDL